MQDIFSNTLPIFLITLFGSIIKRKWLTAEEFWRNLEKLSYFLLFPIVLFNYISKADLSSFELIKLVLGLTVSTILVTIGLIIYRRKMQDDVIQFTSIFQGSIRYNNYIFFGLGNALLGNEGLAIAAVVSAYMIVITNILSVMIFANYIPSNVTDTKRSMILLKLVITNPLIIASILGFIFNYSGIELYVGIKNTLSSLSNSALAIGMLNVGAGLKFIISEKYFRLVVFTSVVKLVILPIVTVIVLSAMSLSGATKSIGLLYSCLPCASTAYVLSRQLGGDPESMASIITFTTIFSVFSLSLLMYILG